MQQLLFELGFGGLCAARAGWCGWCWLLVFAVVQFTLGNWPSNAKCIDSAADWCGAWFFTKKSKMVCVCPHFWIWEILFWFVWDGSKLKLLLFCHECVLVVARQFVGILWCRWFQGIKVALRRKRLAPVCPSSFAAAEFGKFRSMHAQSIHLNERMGCVRTQHVLMCNIYYIYII